MARAVGIGLQSFKKIRQNNCFYVDKTKFIKEWWENRDVENLPWGEQSFGFMSLLPARCSMKERTFWNTIKSR